MQRRPTVPDGRGDGQALLVQRKQDHVRPARHGIIEGDVYSRHRDCGQTPSTRVLDGKDIPSGRGALRRPERHHDTRGASRHDVDPRCRRLELVGARPSALHESADARARHPKLAATPPPEALNKDFLELLTQRMFMTVWLWRHRKQVAKFALPSPLHLQRDSMAFKRIAWKDFGKLRLD